jgi:hypothetical protein
MLLIYKEQELKLATKCPNAISVKGNNIKKYT